MSTTTKTRRTKTGVVTSDKMDRTITVQIERTVLDPIVKKYVRRRKKFLAHDENNEYKQGDHVEIRETRPMSKRKRWRAVRLIKRIDLAQDQSA